MDALNPNPARPQILTSFQLVVLLDLSPNPITYPKTAPERPHVMDRRTRYLYLHFPKHNVLLTTNSSTNETINFLIGLLLTEKNLFKGAHWGLEIVDECDANKDMRSPFAKRYTKR
jgi:hypothetical protein